MKLLVDSGSTKADWLLYDGTIVSGPLHTMGFNPFFHTADTVMDAMMDHPEMVKLRDKITKVKFFRIIGRFPK